MKKPILIVLFLAATSCIFAQNTFISNGTGGGQWTDPDTWTSTPDDEIPHGDAIVTILNGDNVNMNNVDAQFWTGELTIDIGGVMDIDLPDPGIFTNQNGTITVNGSITSSIDGFTHDDESTTTTTEVNGSINVGGTIMSEPENANITGSGAVKGSAYVGPGKVFGILTTAINPGNWVAATTYTGGVDKNWTTEGNWSNGVPNSSISAAIPATGNITVSLNVNEHGYAKDLYLNSGSTLTLNGDLMVEGEVVTEGNVLGTGALHGAIFSGSGTIFAIPTGDLIDGKWAAPSTYTGVGGISGWHGAGAEADPSLGALAIAADLSPGGQGAFTDPFLVYISDGNFLKLTGTLNAPSLEIRGEGNFIVAPGGIVNLVLAPTK